MALSSLRKDRLAALTKTCLTDRCPVKTNLAPDKIARRPALGGSFATGLSFYKSAFQISTEEPQILQCLLDNLNVSGKVLLCPGITLIQEDLRKITDAGGDFICPLPGRGLTDMLPDFTPRNLSRYAAIYLNLDAAHSFYVNEEQDLSCIYSGLQSKGDKVSGTAETWLQWEFIHMTDAVFAAWPELEVDTMVQTFGLSENEAIKLRWGLSDYLMFWHDDGKAASLISLHRKNHATGSISDYAWFTSLPCRHQEEYLRILRSILQSRLSASGNKRITLTDLAPAWAVQQQNRWNLLENMQQADAIAKIIIADILARLQQIKTPARTPKDVHYLLTLHHDDSVRTALHFLLAYYRRSDKYLRNDPLLQNRLWV